MIKRGATGSTVLAALALILSQVPPASAADVGYHVNTSIGHSDNIARTAVDEQSETIASAGVDFSILKRTRKLDLDAVADLAWLEYLDDTFESEVAGNFTGQARIDWIPDRLQWSFRDDFGQTRIDPLAAVTPENRENINYFTTGPDLVLSFTGKTGMRVSGRYSMIDFEETPFDNDRYSGAVALFHDLAVGRTVSLNVQREHISFDTVEVGEDYDRDQAYVRYEVSGGRTNVAVDLGFSRLERDSGSSDGLIARLELERQLTASSSLILSAGREFSDASDRFRLGQGGAGVGVDSTQSGLLTADPFTSTHARLGWEFFRHRTGFGVDVEYYDDEHEQQTNLDRSRSAVGAHFSRDLAPNLQATLRAGYSTEKFEETLANDYQELAAVAGVTKHFGRKLSVSLRYQYISRYSDLALAEFSEGRAWLGLAYGLDAPRRILFPAWQERSGTRSDR